MKKGNQRKAQAAVKVTTIDSESDEDREKIAEVLDRYASQILGESSASCKKKPRSTNETDTVNEDAKPREESLTKKVEVVVFESRKSKSMLGESKTASKGNTMKTPNNQIQRSKYTNERLNSAEVLKKLQFDVVSLGRKAFSKDVQREQERQRAIKLGAKSPKRKYVNYKELIEERKRLKTVEQNASQNESLLNPPTKRKNLGQPKFWKEGNKSYTPQIGKYRDGVLKLSSKDIKSVNKRR